MSNTNVCVFFCGTWSTQNGDNTIANLYKHCSEDYKLILDGPGTDIYNPSPYSASDLRQLPDLIKKVSGSLFGGLSGAIGENNWYANTDKALQYIRQIAREKESLTIFIYGWSRGAVSSFAFINKLANDTFCRTKIHLCYIFAIDPVPGGPTDRLQKLSQFDFYSLPPKESLNCEGIVYYSDSGNVPIVDTRLFNTPCFSGLYIEDERLSYYAFRANHEEIAGKNLGISLQNSFEEHLGNPAFIAALLVYYSIIKKSINRGVKFARPLQTKIEAGAQALLQYYNEIFLNHPDSARKFISRNARLNGENLNKMQYSGRVRKPSIGGLFENKTELQKVLEERK